MIIVFIKYIYCSYIFITHIRHYDASFDDIIYYTYTYYRDTPIFIYMSFLLLL